MADSTLNLKVSIGFLFVGDELTGYLQTFDDICFDDIEGIIYQVMAEKRGLA